MSTGDTTNMSPQRIAAGVNHFGIEKLVAFGLWPWPLAG
jgi:hypothetical protein